MLIPAIKFRAHDMVGALARDGPQSFMWKLLGDPMSTDLDHLGRVLFYTCPQIQHVIMYQVLPHWLSSEAHSQIKAIIKGRDLRKRDGLPQIDADEYSWGSEFRHEDAYDHSEDCGIHSLFDGDGRMRPEYAHGCAPKSMDELIPF